MSNLYVPPPSCERCRFQHYGPCPMELGSNPIALVVALSAEIAALRAVLASAPAPTGHPATEETPPVKSRARQKRKLVPGSRKYEVFHHMKAGEQYTSRRLAEEMGIEFTIATANLSRLAKTGHIRAVGYDGRNSTLYVREEGT